MSSSSSSSSSFSSSPNIRIFATSDSLSSEIAREIQKISEESVKQKGKFCVAFSGGSLPALVAKYLREEPYRSAIDWGKWNVFFVDERFVAPDHPDRNSLICEQELFRHVGIPKSQIFQIDDSLSLEKCAEDYQLRVEQHVPFKEFDLILLGMGPDGHTASLFPSHSLLKERNVLVAPIHDSPKPPPQRITFTFPLIEAARDIIFVCTGESKRQILNEIFPQDPSSPPSSLPSAMVRSSQKEGKLHWFIDTAAAPFHLSQSSSSCL